MLKTLSVLIVLLNISLFTKVQIKKEQLIGKWKLTKLIDKNISEAELLKRYTFSKKSLIYTSAKRNLKSTYKLDEESGRCEWYVEDVKEPILFILKFHAANTLQLCQPNQNFTVGIIEKIE